MLSPESLYQSESQRCERDALILEHLECVRHLLSRMIVDLPAHVDRENLESAGTLGLVEAAQQYDPRRGVPFPAFAIPRIRGAILDELRRNSPLPQRVLKLVATVRRATQTLEPPVTPERIAATTGLTPDEVDEALEAMRIRNIQSWNDNPGIIGGLQDARSEAPEDGIASEDLRRAMADALESLPQQERLVLTLYYHEGLRLREIGEVLDLSESRISRLLARATFRLRQRFHSDPLTQVTGERRRD